MPRWCPLRPQGLIALVHPPDFNNRKCPYCGKEFKPSASHRDQKICSAPDCQRRRRIEYHRKKLVKDPLYRALCEDSQKTWKQRNPGYMKQYRASHREARIGGASLRPAVCELERLLSHVKNNLVKNTSAFRIKRCAPGIWFVAPRTPAGDKNTLGSIQVIILQGIMPGGEDGEAREQRSGNPDGSVV